MKFKLGFKTPASSTSLVEQTDALQDVDYFDVGLFSFLDYLTACETQLAKNRVAEDGEKREVFVDFTKIEDVQDQMFWIRYLLCFGSFIPMNINPSLAAGFKKVASGSPKSSNIEAFKHALEFADKIGSDRAIVVLSHQQFDVVKKLNSLPKALFDAEILLLDSPSRVANEKIFYDIENSGLKVDYFLASSPVMQAAYHTRLDRADREHEEDLHYAILAKSNEKLLIQNLKAFKKLAEGLELSQEDFV